LGGFGQPLEALERELHGKVAKFSAGIKNFTKKVPPCLRTPSGGMFSIRLAGLAR